MSYYIENIFLCLAVPLILSLLFRKGRQQTFTVFVILGMGSCLLSAYVSSFFRRLLRGRYCGGGDGDHARVRGSGRNFFPFCFICWCLNLTSTKSYPRLLELPLDSLLLKMYVISQKTGQQIFPMC